MTATTYTVTTADGWTFTMAADLSRSDSSIDLLDIDDYDGETRYTPTSYQSADACHDVDRAAQLAADYAADLAGEPYELVVSVEERDIIGADDDEPPMHDPLAGEWPDEAALDARDRNREAGGR